MRKMRTTSPRGITRVSAGHDEKQDKEQCSVDKPLSKVLPYLREREEEFLSPFIQDKQKKRWVVTCLTLCGRPGPKHVLDAKSRALPAT